MLRDRGKVKWQGFFMPEHIKMLREANFDKHKQSRPHLDDSQIEDMKQLLLESLNDQILLEITT
jgi:hypothetical protein